MELSARKVSVLEQAGSIVQGGARCSTKVQPVFGLFTGTYLWVHLPLSCELALRTERQYPFEYNHFPYYSQYMGQLSEFTSKDGVLRLAKGQNGENYPGITLPKETFVDLDRSQGFGALRLGTSTIVGSRWEENGKTRGSNRCEELLERLLA